MRTATAWAGSTSGAGGSVYNLTFNRVYGSGGGALPTSAHLSTPGDVIAWPVLRIYGPITLPRVTFTYDNGDAPGAVVFVAPFIIDAGHFVEVDTAREDGVPRRGPRPARARLDRLARHRLAVRARGRGERHHDADRQLDDGHDAGAGRLVRSVPLVSWPQGRAPDGTEQVALGPVSLAAIPTAVPPGRGRWRLHLQARQFGPAARSAPLAELTSARSRRLEQTYNAPAQLTFTLSGRSPEARALAELRSDVVATRWDETSGRDVDRLPRDRGADRGPDKRAGAHRHRHLSRLPQDAREPHAHRRLGDRRRLDQDEIVADGRGGGVERSPTSGGTSFGAGSYLPLVAARSTPTARPVPRLSGQLRDRAYLGNQKLDEALSNLAAVINGFDYDLVPYGTPGADADAVRVFYPYQGAQRFDMALVYGSSVSALTRTVNSGDYANYWRVLGEGTEEAQLYAEATNTDAIDVTVSGLGLWQSGDNASDVTIQSTLDDKAHGDLAASSILTPSYTVTMRPGAYSWGSPEHGRRRAARGALGPPRCVRRRAGGRVRL